MITQEQRLCRMWIVGKAWFYTEVGTDRLICVVNDCLEKNPEQELFDRISDIPEPVRTAFVEKINGVYVAEDAGDFDRMVNVRVPNPAEAFYRPGVYNGD